MSSPMKSKDVGELGLCGVGAAIANAIYNAAGLRVRDYPITLDKSLNTAGRLSSRQVAHCFSLRLCEGRDDDRERVLGRGRLKFLCLVTRSVEPQVASICVEQNDRHRLAMNGLY